MKKFMKGVRFTPKNYSDEVEAKIQHYKKEGYKLPMRSALRTEEQLAGIRASAKINTALLDYLSENIREGHPKSFDSDFRDDFFRNCIANVDILYTHIGTTLEPVIRHFVVVVFTALMTQTGIAGCRVLLCSVIYTPIITAAIVVQKD